MILASYQGKLGHCIGNGSFCLFPREIGNYHDLFLPGQCPADTSPPLRDRYGFSINIQRFFLANGIDGVRGF